MQHLGTLRQLSLGDLADDRRERGGGEIMPSLMATSLRWRTHSARTKILGKPRGIPRVNLECGPAQPSLFTN
jgi:hypothetical protein